MQPNQKPHSREKHVESGSADLNKGRQVNNGSRPVGNGGRTSGTSGKRSISGLPFGTSSGNTSGSQSLPVKLNLKTILILAAILIVGFIILKTCGGNLPIFPDIDPDNGGNNGGEVTDNNQYEDYKDGVLDYSVSPDARPKRVTPLGNGNDVVTIMIYMCGTDLESKYGMATADLQEMMKANISDKVNIIVETGGCSKWKNNTISNTKNQIYQVRTDALALVKDNAGNASMTDPNNLADFINFCNTNFPANRNVLIFWDHGGGSVSGYGYDEKNPNSSSMTLSKIKTALDKANCNFDFIGFDACLMATLENALVCEGHADYLLASEETEPGTGWYYTRWLNELSQNTSKPTIEIAKTIIDDFVTSSSSSSANAKVTLSVVDLAELHGTVPSAFSEFASSTNEMIRSDSYDDVANARAGVRQFSQKINQVDLVDLANRIATDDSKALAAALKGCVKYNRASLSKCYGISIYFPYENTNSVNSAVSSYEALGIDSEYTKCIKSFASLELGGQITASASQTSASSGSSFDLLGSLLSSFAGGESSTSPIDILTGSFTSSGSSAAGLSVDPSSIISLLSGFSGRSMPAELSWVDTDLIAGNAEKIAANYIDASRITATSKDGKSVLSLTDAEWALIETVELNVFGNDGNGYIDLGLDNTFEMNGNDLLLDYDGTWMTLNGNVCAYYLVSDTEQDDGTYVTIGRIPALLNRQPVDIQVVFDAKNPKGVVTGAFPTYSGGETDVQAKGCVAIKAGDKIELLCDYYNLDGTYSASYTLGTVFTVPESGLKVANMKVNADGFSVMYRLTDIYGNHFWTPEFNH